MKGQFVTGDYDGESKGINGYIRCENGEKKKVLIQGFQPYFYVPADEYIQNDTKMLEVKSGYTGLHGEKLKKIIMEKPTDVRDFRNNFKQHYEADIRFIRRFMIDCSITNGAIMNEGVTYYTDIKPYEYIAKPLIGIIDIEVWNELRFPTSDKYPIISVTVHDPRSGFLTVLVAKETKTEKVGEGHKVMYVQSETDLIKFVNRYIEVASPDVLTGWNVGWDLGYLKDRAKILGVSLKFNGTCVFDLYEAYRYMYKRGSNRLKDVVIAEKLTDKVVAPGFDPKWYPDNLNKLIEYNKTDVEYCIRINEKFKLIEFYWMMKSLAGMEDMESTMHHGTLVDTLMLRMYYKKYVLSSKPDYDKTEYDEGDQYEGAVVFDPPRGIFENVAVFDMSRYYPSIVIAYHLSPERQDFVPNLCKRLMTERDKLDRQLKMCAPGSKEYDDLKPRRDSFKYFLNAVYGYFGSKTSRMYQKEIAEKVTEVGRRGLILLKKKVEEIGQVVLYGDSVHGTSLVSYYNENTLVSEDIENLFTKYPNETSVRIDGKEEINLIPFNLKTFSLDKNGKVSLQQIKRIIRHKTNKPIYRITTESNKEIIVTEDHSLITNENGGWNSKKPKELNTNSIIKEVCYDFDRKNGKCIFDCSKEKMGESRISRTDYNKNERKNVYTRIQEKNPDCFSKNVDESGTPYETETNLLYQRIQREYEPKIEREMERPKLQKKMYGQPYRKESLEYWPYRRTAERKNGKYQIRELDQRGKTIEDKKLGTYARRESFMSTGWIEYDKQISQVFESRNGPIQLIDSEQYEFGTPQTLPRDYTGHNNRRKIVDYGGWLLVPLLSRTFSNRYQLNSNTKCVSRQKSKLCFRQTKSSIYKNMGMSNTKPPQRNYQQDTNLTENFRNSKITKIEDLGNYSGYVYDLEIENTHSFLANGIFVHNTDSVAIKMTMKPEEMEYYLNKKLEEFCAEEKVEPLLKLKFEKMFKTVLYTGVKKRYAGWVVLEGAKAADYIHITGFEYVRRDACKVTKDIQYKMFEHVLKGTSNVFVEELKKSIEQIRKGEVELDDIAIPKSINKNIADYKTVPDYVRGSIYSNKYLHGDIHAGDTVKMIYVNGIKGYPKTNVVCYLDKSTLPEGIEIDYEKLVDKAIRLKVEDVLEIIGVDADVLFNKGLRHIKSLDEVF
jgi:DNA polymerase elongation subunit (family B)